MAISKENLSLAGEFRVASELLKRDLFAGITYGNRKATDIVAVGKNRRAVIVEVKASQGKNFVTNLYQKYGDEKGEVPDFWVLCRFTEEVERFFVLTHSEMAVVQGLRNSKGKKMSYAQYAALYPKGVDNVLITHVEQYENAWQKIVDCCNK